MKKKNELLTGYVYLFLYTSYSKFSNIIQQTALKRFGLRMSSRI